MNRPLLLRCLPNSLRTSVAERFYRKKARQWVSLYESAPLRFAPQVTMELLPGDIISDHIALTGIWELNLTRRVFELARRGGTLVELGANLGYFSLLWASASPSNRVHAFEASPRNIGFLSRNIARNSFESRIQLHPVAAGKDAGWLEFNAGSTEQTGWGGFAAAGSTLASIRVEVVRVDEAVETVGPIDLLKIDIEGADTWALMGCERLLRERRVKQIWYEQNKPRMQRLGIAEGEPEAFLRSVGYESKPESDTSSDSVDWSAQPAG